MRKRGVTLFAIFSNLLYWLSEYTKFVYIDNLMVTTTIFTILSIIITFLHENIKVLTKENESPDSYLSRLVDFVKVFIIPFIIYLISYSVVFFVNILGIFFLNKIALIVNGGILILLIHKQILSIKDIKKLTSASWLKDFITNIYVPITIGLMSIVALESIYSFQFQNIS